MGLLSLLLAAHAAYAQATLSAVGDIRLDGPVGELIKAGRRTPSPAVLKALRADIVFGNLECSVTRRGSKQDKKWQFRSPPANLRALKRAGFTVLNIANNHTWDYGRTGFLDTLSALKKSGLPAIGGGRDREEAERLKVVKVRGLRVGLMGFTSTFPDAAWAKRGKPGVAYSDFARFPAAIRDARGRCDVLVVSFHGGTELAQNPNDIQRAFAHAAVDAGADLVLGHHPHVLQALEVYKDKPILYSLGNFLFVSPSTGTNVTVVARAALSEKGVDSLEFVPVDTHWGTPSPAGEKERRAAYEALDRLGALARDPDRFKLAAAEN